jgi:hypothetical protein
MLKNLSPNWWLMPVILGTWEAEIGKIMFTDPPGQKHLQDPITVEKS